MVNPAHPEQARTERERLERAYRRGYHQSLYFTLEALDRGATREQLGTWLREVAAWRRRPPFDDVDITPAMLPPEPPC